jgi:hypothetical protein
MAVRRRRRAAPSMPVAPKTRATASTRRLERRRPKVAIPRGAPQRSPRTEPRAPGEPLRRRRIRRRRLSPGCASTGVIRTATRTRSASPGGAASPGWYRRPTLPVPAILLHVPRSSARMRAMEGSARYRARARIPKGSALAPLAKKRTASRGPIGYAGDGRRRLVVPSLVRSSAPRARVRVLSAITGAPVAQSSTWVPTCCVQVAIGPSSRRSRANVPPTSAAIDALCTRSGLTERASRNR